MHSIFHARRERVNCDSFDKLPRQEKIQKREILRKSKNFFQKKSNFCQKFETEKKYQNKNFDLCES